MSLVWPSCWHSDCCCCLLFMLPWPVVVCSCWNFGFLPSWVVTQETWPPLLVNVPPWASHCLWLGEAAKAGSAMAKTRRATATNIVMRLIKLLSFSLATSVAC